MITCPHCGGQPLGMKWTHDYDGVLYWICTACAHAWHRWDGLLLQRIAQPYIDAHNAA